MLQVYVNLCHMFSSAETCQNNKSFNQSLQYSQCICTCIRMYEAFTLYAHITTVRYVSHSVSVCTYLHIDTEYVRQHCWSTCIFMHTHLVTYLFVTWFVVVVLSMHIYVYIINRYVQMYAWRMQAWYAHIANILVRVYGTMLDSLHGCHSSGAFVKLIIAALIGECGKMANPSTG